jgi:hypothetical protein
MGYSEHGSHISCRVVVALCWVVRGFLGFAVRNFKPIFGCLPGDETLSGLVDLRQRQFLLMLGPRKEVVALGAIAVDPAAIVGAPRDHELRAFTDRILDGQRGAVATGDVRPFGLADAAGLVILKNLDRTVAAGAVNPLASSLERIARHGSPDQARGRL